MMKFHRLYYQSNDYINVQEQLNYNFVPTAYTVHNDNNIKY
jgi:hypothetical protein